MTNETNLVAEYRDWSNNIPVDVLGLILLNLKSVKDIKQFQAVCKQWRLAATSYKDQALLLTSELLVAKIYTKSGFTAHLPLADIPFSMSVDINEMMQGASILCSNHGWLLMNKGCYKVFFFNFFSKSIIKLPSLPKSGVNFLCSTFTSSPTSEDCLVFGVSPHPYSRHKHHAFSLSVGDKNWMWRTFENDFHEIIPYLSSCSGNIVYHRGMFYCVWDGGTLVVFDGKLEFMKPVRAEKVATRCITKSYILEVDGELFSVFTSNMCWEACTCKWDDSNRIWHQVNDIGEYTFFLSDKTSYAKKSMAQSMRNKLYFPHLDGMKHGVFYCLKSGEFQSRGNVVRSVSLFKRCFMGIFNTTYILESCWMDTTQCEWVEKSKHCLVSNMDDDGNTIASNPDIDDDEARHIDISSDEDYDDDDYDDDDNDDDDDDDDELYMLGEKTGNA